MPVVGENAFLGQLVRDAVGPQWAPWPLVIALSSNLDCARPEGFIATTVATTLAQNRAPRLPGPRMQRLLWLGVIASLLLMAGLLVLVWGLGDAWWAATAVLFGPRWIWGVPLLLLTPVALLVDRRALVPLAFGAVILTTAGMGFRTPSLRVVEQEVLGGTPVDLRVMSYNVGGGDVPTDALLQFIADARPDIVVLEEREQPISAEGYTTHCDIPSCLLSRFPIRVAEPRKNRSDFWPYFGSGIIVRYEIETPGGLVEVQAVHLATVRHGLQSVIRKRAWLGAADLKQNIWLRDWEAREARIWAEHGKLPLIVMGDFNIPVESAIYRRHWGDLTNALSEAGFGFSFTKRTNWHGIRIDHVLVSAGWEVEKAVVFPSLGGDHRPVIAELRIVGQGRNAAIP